MITAPLFDQTLCPSKPARAIQSLVRAHWLTTVGGVVNRFTGITQIRHLVMAITVDDSDADPQTRFRLGDETPAPHMRFGKLSTKEIAAFKAIE
jgi:hypothetical protein